MRFPVNTSGDHVNVFGADLVKPGDILMVVETRLSGDHHASRTRKCELRAFREKIVWIMYGRGHGRFAR